MQSRTQLNLQLLREALFLRSNKDESGTMILKIDWKVAKGRGKEEIKSKTS